MASGICFHASHCAVIVLLFLKTTVRVLNIAQVPLLKGNSQVHRLFVQAMKAIWHILDWAAV